MAALAVILVLFFLCVMRDKEEPAGLCRFHGCDLDATTNWKSVPVCAEHKDWLDNEQ